MNNFMPHTSMYSCTADAFISADARYLLSALSLLPAEITELHDVLIFSSCQLFTDKIILYLFLQLSCCEFSNVFPDFLALTLPSCSYHLLTLSITAMSPAGRLLGLPLAKLVTTTKGSHGVWLQMFDAVSWKSKSLQSRVVNWV